MIKKKKRIDILKIILYFLMVGSSIMIYFTIFRMIPVIVMVAAYATKSNLLIKGTATFIYSWLFINSIFLISIIGLLLKKILNKKTIKKLRK